MVVFLILHLCRSISSSCNRWNDLLSKRDKINLQVRYRTDNVKDWIWTVTLSVIQMKGFIWFLVQTHIWWRCSLSLDDLKGRMCFWERNPDVQVEVMERSVGVWKCLWFAWGEVWVGVGLVVGLGWCACESVAVRRADSYVRIQRVTLKLIVLCCNRGKTDPGAAEGSCWGSCRNLCPGRDGRQGRWTPRLETTSADRSGVRHETTNRRMLLTDLRTASKNNTFN